MEILDKVFKETSYKLTYANVKDVNGIFIKPCLTCRMESSVKTKGGIFRKISFICWPRKRHEWFARIKNVEIFRKCKLKVVTKQTYFNRRFYSNLFRFWTVLFNKTNVTKCNKGKLEQNLQVKVINY